MEKSVLQSTSKRLVERGKKRLGRGHGSGKVKTSGRGTKGQKARGTIPMGFEGGQLPLTRRLPYLRGKGRNQSQKGKAYPVSLSRLSALPKGSVVTLESLKKSGIIDEGTLRVKLLSPGEIQSALTVHVPCSKKAKEIIEKAGGTVQ